MPVDFANELLAKLCPCGTSPCSWFACMSWQAKNKAIRGSKVTSINSLNDLIFLSFCISIDHITLCQGRQGARRPLNTEVIPFLFLFFLLLQQGIYDRLCMPYLNILTSFLTQLFSNWREQLFAGTRDSFPMP